MLNSNFFCALRDGKIKKKEKTFINTTNNISGI